MNVSGQLDPLVLQPRGESSLYQLDRRVGGSQNWSERSGEETIPVSAGNQNPIFQSSSP